MVAQPPPLRREPSDATKSRRPFKLTLALAGIPVLVIAVLVLIILYGPEAQEARRVANQIKCSSNMLRIAIAIGEYADADAAGEMPPDLATLARANLPDPLTADLLIDPQPNGRSERAGVGPATQWAGKIVPGSKYCDYLYVYTPGRFAQLDPQRVLLIEPLDAHETSGINVMYADRQVDFVPIDAARTLYGRLLGGHNPP